MGFAPKNSKKWVRPPQTPKKCGGKRGGGDRKFLSAYSLTEYNECSGVKEYLWNENML